MKRFFTLPRNKIKKNYDKGMESFLIAEKQAKENGFESLKNSEEYKKLCDILEYLRENDKEKNSYNQLLFASQYLIVNVEPQGSSPGT